MSQGNFAIFHRPSRSGFLETITEDEVAIVQRHFEYLRHAPAAGRLRTWRTMMAANW